MNSAISIYYYLGIAAAAFVVEKPSETPLAKVNAGLSATMAVCAAGLVFAAVLTYPLMQWINSGRTVQALKPPAPRYSYIYEEGDKGWTFNTPYNTLGGNK